jgi:hypothetical protein
LTVSAAVTVGNGTDEYLEREPSEIALHEAEREHSGSQPANRRSAGAIASKIEPTRDRSVAVSRSAERALKSGPPNRCLKIMRARPQKELKHQNLSGLNP